MRKITLQMTVRRARELGLLTCKNCRWPENNHFSWGKEAVRPRQHLQEVHGNRHLRRHVGGVVNVDGIDRIRWRSVYALLRFWIATDRVR